MYYSLAPDWLCILNLLLGIVRNHLQVNRQTPQYLCSYLHLTNRHTVRFSLRLKPRGSKRRNSCIVHQLVTNKMIYEFFDHVFQQELDLAKGKTGLEELHGASNINKASDNPAWLLYICLCRLQDSETH